MAETTHAGSSDATDRPAPGAEAPAPIPELKIDLACDPTISYAHVQNHVPVVRKLQITNALDRALGSMEVLVSCDPEFAEPMKLRFDRLEIGESRTIAPLDLAPNHGYLAKLTESERARINVRVRAGEQELASTSQPIDVLAYDQWAGARALPELLAAFCQPNAPAIDRLLASASEQLQRAGFSLNGYQGKDRQSVWAQVSAIYNAIAALNLQYSEPPASFGMQGQKIRTPDRMTSGGLGTCLDLTMLCASCLEQAGLNPVVLFQDDHAWVGCWLLKTQFPTPTVEDAQAVRKRVEAGELLVFETTGLAQAARPSLKVMHGRGLSLLRDELKFRFAVDIARARERQILPLPSRDEATAPSPRGDGTAPAIEEAPILPPLDPIVLPETAIEGGEDLTPAGRLARWSSKLLDLSLRNRMLNFKGTKSNLRLQVPDPAQLEDVLVEGREFKIKAMPRVMEGVDPRSAQVHLQRVGNDVPEQIAKDAVARGELLALVEPKDLDARLLAVHGAARTSLEEGGTNTLFLALGFLEWRDTEKSDLKHKAPLVLVPVTMTRKSVHGGFRIKRHDDETIINPTLRQFLKSEHMLNIPALENPPTDASGLDVAKIWQAVRLAINHIAGWEVTTEVYLANLSFAKYLMWVDLQARTEALKQNRVVAHLIDHAGQTFPTEVDESADGARLDDTHKPQDILAPLLADSSQLRVIAEAARGRDLVCEGPPGTGKSQSITNLIANLLAQDKTVLFVSEKMAALSVVQRRLNAMGLGPFCLELYSAKASKSEVVKQLGQALDAAGNKSVRDWEFEANTLHAKRQELNTFVDVLHREYRCGLTVYEATGRAVANRGLEAAAMPWTDPETHDRAALDDLRALVRRMSVLVKEIGEVANHPLGLIGRTEWTPTYEDHLFRMASEVGSQASALEAAGNDAFKAMGLPVDGTSLRDLAAFDTLGQVLLNAPSVPAAFAARAHDAHLRGRVATLAVHGAKRASIWAEFGNRFADDLAKENGGALTQAWTAAKATWWPKSWFAKRALAKRLASFRVGGERPNDAEVDELLPALVSLNEQDQHLAQFTEEATLFAESPQQTDWKAVARHRAWAESLSKALSEVTGADVDRLVALRSRITPLVSDLRDLLARDGAIGRKILAYRDAHTAFRNGLQAFEKEAGARASLVGGPEAVGALATLRAVLGDWHRGRAQLRMWCIWSGLRAEALGKGLSTVVIAAETGKVSLKLLPDFFEYSYACWFLARVMDRERALSSFSGMDHQRKIDAFREADENFQNLTRMYVYARLCSKMPSGSVPAGPDSEMGTLRREIQRQRGHMPMRKLIQTLPTLLPRLKPCLLMSPLSIAQYLPPDKAQFDVVVFDEASQIPVWDAVGAIARGRHVVVVGDPKQLPPTDFFNRTDDEHSSGEGEVQDLESILDELTSTGLKRYSLQWHYRSRSESLIAFSNHQYYANGMITFPSPDTDDRAVELRPVAGVYDRGKSTTNRIEADAVVDEIAQHFKDPARRSKTVGVVTFNLSQCTLIEDLLEARRRADLELDRLIAEHVEEPLFIKNLEGVQGDERDLIMFSVTYGPDVSGRVTNHFGPLNLEGGHRRLNVAVTRARERVLLFSSLGGEMINPATVSARGVLDLKLYLEYAKKGPKALAEVASVTGRTEESPFERSVANALRDRGWTVHPQVGVSAYRIDLGVVDPRAPGRYLLGVEADGRTYHSAASARDRDRLRQLILEGLGWRIHRIWSTDWFYNHDRQLEKLLALLDELVAQVPQDDAPSTPGRESGGDSGVSMHEEVASAVVEESPTNAPPVYARLTLPSVPLGLTFDASTLAQLKERLEKVVTEEGPIRDSELFQRVATSAGWQRVGTRIDEQLRKLAGSAFPKVKDREGTFYFRKGTVLTQWRDFRVCDEARPETRRHAREVSLPELANIVLYLLEQGGNSTLAGLCKDVGSLVGMQRVTTDAEKRIGKAVTSLVDDNLLTLNGDTYSLTQVA